ncbi:hypothetical protein EDB89DRAFT_2239791 [Lactarius sanguifluus]|nr:hypothetical protein EDB89DRAFT_2239791 [Lactarius sanguifluus]
MAARIEAHARREVADSQISFHERKAPSAVIGTPSRTWLGSVTPYQFKNPPHDPIWFPSQSHVYGGLTYCKSGDASGLVRAGVQRYKDAGILGVFGASYTAFKHDKRLLPTRAQDEPVQILAGFISVWVQPPQVTVRLAHSALLRRRDPQPIHDTDHPTFHTRSLLQLIHASQPALSASSSDLDIGALAGTAAQMISYPFEVVRWRIDRTGTRPSGTKRDHPDPATVTEQAALTTPQAQAGPHYSNRRTHRGQYLRQSTSIGFRGQFQAQQPRTETIPTDAARNIPL